MIVAVETVEGPSDSWKKVREATGAILEMYQGEQIIPVCTYIHLKEQDIQT